MILFVKICTTSACSSEHPSAKVHLIIVICLCKLFAYCDLYICISMGLVAILLSRVLRKQPRVTFEEPSLKRRRLDKEVMECEGEPLLQESRPEVGQLSEVSCRDVEIDTSSMRHIF